MELEIKKSEGKENTFHEQKALNRWNKLIFQEQTFKKIKCDLVSSRKSNQDLSTTEICTIFEWHISNPPKTNIL